MRTGNDPSGKNVVIMGRSNIVGKPLAALLMQKAAGANATVTITHTGTPDVAYHTRQADIVVAAVGVPNALTADMIRPGAVVIDVGNNRVPDATRKSGYRMVGDIDFEAIKRSRVLGDAGAGRRRADDGDDAAGQHGGGGRARCAGYAAT